MGSTRWQDLETLEYKGSSVPADTAYTLSCASIDTNRALCEEYRECQSDHNIQFAFNGIDEQTRSQTISGAPYHQSKQSCTLEEPTRRLRPFNGPAGKPKRFFRTFWRGLSTRALNVKNLETSMNE